MYLLSQTIYGLWTWGVTGRKPLTQCGPQEGNLKGFQFLKLHLVTRRRRAEKALKSQTAKGSFQLLNYTRE